MDSGDTFYVTYHFLAEQQPEAEKVAENIAIEQTAELPITAIGDNHRSFVGIVSDLTQLSDNKWQTTIHYKKVLVSGDVVQFLNVIFGNVSIKPGIKITDLDRHYLAEIFPGPACGIQGIRKMLSVYQRPLSCTALKPLGSSSNELAEKAGQFAAGGIDIIKDDHGLVNQPMADFETRVRLVLLAIRNAEQETGKKSLYFPNITGSAEDIHNRVMIAQNLGADGVVIAPQLTGLICLTNLARTQTGLPIMAHPSFSGPYTIHKNSGFEPSVYYGLLWRAMGADCIIYPNSGGRFSYSYQQCKSINKECRDPSLNVRSALPVPAGGIDRNSLISLIKNYGSDTLFLIGGSLYKHPEGLKIAAKQFQHTLRDYE